MSNPDLTNAISNLREAYDAFKAEEEKPREVSPYGKKRVDYILALGAAVLAIGDHLADS
ncbi:hypothetical protein MJO55_25700 [Mycolicibacterium rufum]|uniref:Uncharacterized protein n=1 Tax=Mycolicibacterium rufum TaxID=318424 RepID=A0A9X2YJ40_9MYCO|nr:hypothetical protein [Mycolicibacterium rufum]MBI5339017.1 hypothetical protein [Mycolicibacterium rufum]MCV7074160.1 hypothetical protein [Mycolicibacterium rufum]ULP36536.1 hypothetical protein MJO55_25700 [Mycolicibacterium rufum]